MSELYSFDNYNHRLAIMYISFTLVGLGELIINIYSAWRWQVENKITMRDSVVSGTMPMVVPSLGPEKKIMLVFQGSVILNA